MTVGADTDTLLVSTRKGLFTVTGRGAAARITGAAFVGDNVTLALADRRDGAWYAALDHGHFGVKVHRSDGRVASALRDGDGGGAQCAGRCRARRAAA